MNRGVVQSSPVQQMMGGSPNWWNINTMRPPLQQTSPLLASHPSLFPPCAPPPPPPQHPTHPPLIFSWNGSQDIPAESLSQLLMAGLVGTEEDRNSMMSMQAKKLENWEEQVMIQTRNNGGDGKGDYSGNNYGAYGHGSAEFQQGTTKVASWTQMVPASATSPRSCVTTLSSNNNMLEFSSKADARHPQPDRSSECNSNATGGASKKPRVQSSSQSTTFKVRKEKLGDRITALHQLVSPFGKTDTASVLLEAIGYIRFLQGQIEALSLPYLGAGSGSIRQQPQKQDPVQGEMNSLNPQDVAPMSNDNCLKRKGRPNGSDTQEVQEEGRKDLRSRGLCLVPISCTLQVGSDNGADYWASALGGGFR